MIRRLLLVSAFLSSTICVLISSTGGFSSTVFGLRLSARSPLTSAVVAVAACALWLAAAWRGQAISDDLTAVAAWVEGRATALVALMASLSGAIAVRFHTFSASGADASGYLSEAAMLASGLLSYAEPLAQVATWADGARTLAPLGWHPTHGSAQVPTYSVGLPLAMALPHVLAQTIGASLVVAASAALAVWFAGRTAIVLAGGTAGVLTAAALATVPVHLYESMQPMSDVPVTAAWAACWYWLSSTVAVRTGGLAGRVTCAGVAAAVAVLIRPNLAPLAIVPALYLWSQAGERGRAVTLAFALPVAAAGLLIAYLQWRWFGSPLRSGYGSASEIYSLTNMPSNLRLYFQWLIETNGVWLLAAPLVVLMSSWTLLRWMVVFAMLVVFAYLIYGPFESWPYLRFLLPAIAIACIAVCTGIAGLLARMTPAARGPLAIALALAIAAWQLTGARELDVFTVAARHARALVAGEYLASVTRDGSVLIAGEQSGAMRYYTARSIVRWDFLRPDALAEVQQALSADGRDIWIVLDDWEVAFFRGKFRTTPFGALDWPPLLDAGTVGRVQAWRLADRARFDAGARVITDRLR